MDQTTRSSLLRRARQGGEEGRKALGELFEIYRPAVRKYVLRRYPTLAQEVDDVADEFMFTKFVEGHLTKLYVRSPGRRFRSYLKTALCNYCLDILKKKQRKSERLGGPTYTLEDFDQPDSTAFDEFEVLWAREVFGRAVRCMKRECDTDSRRLAAAWGIFRARFLQPFRGRPETPYPELVARFGLSSPKDAQKAATEGKRMFAKVILGVLAKYWGPEDAHEELYDLWSILGRAGGLPRESCRPLVLQRYFLGH